MKTIGLIGGMSWESTITYYQILNQAAKERLGGLHSAQCILYSVDFDALEKHMSAGEWQEIAAILSSAAQSLEKAGADFILICTNTMHKLFDEVQAGVRIPLLHIADVTADALLEKKIEKVALLGTSYTMEQDFYTTRLGEKGLAVMIPDAQDRRIINDIIFKELCMGIITEESKCRMLEIIAKLSGKGAQGAILGCTEIGLLINGQDTPTPLFDTTVIHAQAAARYAID